MTSTSLLDVAAWSTQVACIAAIAGLLPALLRLDAPGVRYAYFRTLLVLCLALPWLQARQAMSEGAAVDTIMTAAAGASVPAGIALAPPFPWIPALGLCLASGMLIRGVWIAMGLVRLARLRASGEKVACVEEHDELQHLLGTRAEIRYVPDLGQPVTFGTWRPIVLLPAELRSHPAHVQRAVVSHELIHVQRRDWMWLVAEEIVRAVFWFHPAVWWMISRVQLAREEVVDESAMLATGTRRGYLEALAAFAERVPLVPAAAFARRRHLLRRMRLISKGVHMSARRIAWSSAVMALVVIGSTWYAVTAFPLRAAPAQALLNEAGPLEKQAKPITPENPVPRRTYSVDPEYPAEAAVVDARAMVTLMITLDAFGRVAEVRRLGVAPIPNAADAAVPDAQALGSAFDALVTSAAEAVRQWQYDAPAEAPLSIRVMFAFSAPGTSRLVAHDGWSLTGRGQSAGFGARGGRGGTPQSAPPPPPPPPPDTRTDAPPWASGALRIGGAVLAPVKTKHVPPIYPEMAMSAKVQGVVILEALIGVNGKVTNARVVRSVPALDQAALDAVMQWEFTPTRLNGQPAPVLMTVTVQFTLA